MPRTLIRKLLVLLLLVLSVVSWQWLYEREPEVQQAPQPVSSLRNKTDYFLEQFSIQSADPKQTMRLSGDTLAHYTETGLSSVTSPQIRLADTGDRFWQGSARSGSLSADYKFLILEGDVTLTHHQPSAADITIRTESLKIDTSTRSLSTEAAVEIRSTGWSFNSTGMRARLDESKLIFPASVEAQYAPGS